MRERIRAMMAEVFQLDLATLPEDASAEQLAEWDSLAHLELMLALEMEFGIEISSEVMPALLSEREIELYLSEQGVRA